MLPTSKIFTEKSPEKKYDVLSIQYKRENGNDTKILGKSDVSKETGKNLNKKDADSC